MQIKLNKIIWSWTDLKNVVNITLDEQQHMTYYIGSSFIEQKLLKCRSSVNN